MNAVSFTASSAFDWQVPDVGPWPAENNRHHIVVVGAGIGGLSAAALLAKRGLKVLVVEAHDRVGGYCSSWTRTVRGRDGVMGRFTFDAGVQDISGLGPKGAVLRMLRAVEGEGRIVWRRVFHRYVQEGRDLDVPENLDALIARLGDLFPHELSGISAFFAEMAAIHGDLYDEMDDSNGIPSPPDTPEAFSAWKTRRPHASYWLLKPYSEMLDRFIADRHLRKFLTTIAEYITDLPESVTVGDMAPLFGYYFEGGHYPVGGSQRLAELLRTVVEENGGRVLLRTTVTQILCEQGSVVGISTGRGERHFAPVVIANADVVSTLTELIGNCELPTRFSQRTRRLQRGPSAILLSLALDILPALPARVFVSADGLHFGIGNPSVIDPTLAPPGHAALTILCLLSEEEAATWFDNDRLVYKALKEVFAKRLIAAAETVIPCLRQHILYRQTASPTTFLRYARTRNGNIYGAARGQWCPAVKSPVLGLLLVGGGCQDGPGIEAVVLSGMRAASLISGGLPLDRNGRQPFLISHLVAPELYDSAQGIER
jgi:all-trans-retinol 13,14-reductase